ncbi:MAG: beta-ketoacyl synthase chain length factor [Cellvibrionaceae bacterium]
MVNFYQSQNENLNEKPENFQEEGVKLQILSVGQYVEKVNEHSDKPLPELKTLVKESTGKAIRRITRFVQLALIGASRCCKNIEVDKNASVYFASCRGDTGVTVDLLNGLVRDQQPPAPLSFVNSVSNAACFQVAKSVGVFGGSNFITNRYDPIFAALQLAQSDFIIGSASSALIGSVDCCSSPLEEHRRRVHLSASQDLVEASNWLLVTNLPAKKESAQDDSSIDDNAIGVIEELRYFSSLELLIQWLKIKDVGADTVLGVGQHLSDSDVISIMEEGGVRHRFDYVGREGHYDSPTGEGIIRFLHEQTAIMMLHVNSDPSGRFTVFMVCRNG